jgi:hypothetical protein
MSALMRKNTLFITSKLIIKKDILAKKNQLTEIKPQSKIQKTSFEGNIMRLKNFVKIS